MLWDDEPDYLARTPEKWEQFLDRLRQLPDSVVEQAKPDRERGEADRPDQAGGLSTAEPSPPSVHRTLANGNGRGGNR